jgi:hypothetical protein
VHVFGGGGGGHLKRGLTYGLGLPSLHGGHGINGVQLGGGIFTHTNVPTKTKSSPGI